MMTSPRNDFEIGTRLYYTGDIANDADRGIIDRIEENRWGRTYWLLMDGGGVFALRSSAISSTYDGTCSSRFVLLSAYEQFRAERIADMANWFPGTVGTHFAGRAL